MSPLVGLIKFGMVWDGLVWFVPNFEAACRLGRLSVGSGRLSVGSGRLCVVSERLSGWVGRSGGVSMSGSSGGSGTPLSNTVFYDTHDISRYI